MKVEQYNPTDMSLLDNDVTGVDFGYAILGNHNSQAVVIRPVADGGVFSQIALFLEDNGGLDHCQFGKLKSNTEIPGIEPGDAVLSDVFVETPGISDVSQIAQFSDNGILYDASEPEYTWIDMEAGIGEINLADQTVNFRFIFEYV